MGGSIFPDRMAVSLTQFPICKFQLGFHPGGIGGFAGLTLISPLSSVSRLNPNYHGLMLISRTHAPIRRVPLGFVARLSA
jgi:hypothetical protein